MSMHLIEIVYRRAQSRPIAGTCNRAEEGKNPRQESPLLPGTNYKSRAEGGHGGPPHWGPPPHFCYMWPTSDIFTIAWVVKKALSTAPMLMYQHSRSGVSMPGR
jgi:hypothetical protein